LAGVTGRAGDKDLKTFSIGASYRVGPAKVFGAWSQTRRPLQLPLADTGLVQITSATKVDVFYLGVDYSLKTKMRLLATVIHDRADISRVAAGNTKGKTTQHNLGVDYFLSKRTDVYAIYSRQSDSEVINLGVIGAAYSFAPADGSSQNVVRIGLRNKF